MTTGLIVGGGGVNPLLMTTGAGKQDGAPAAPGAAPGIAPPGIAPPGIAPPGGPLIIMVRPPSLTTVMVEFIVTPGDPV
ncbi:MAG: hypothetical protein ABIV28_05760, partial [Longimicrobiales bacterium]